MASKLSFVFFRNRSDNDDILVKFSLNGKALSLPYSTDGSGTVLPMATTALACPVKDRKRLRSPRNLGRHSSSTTTNITNQY